MNQVPAAPLEFGPFPAVHGVTASESRTVFLERWKISTFLRLVKLTNRSRFLAYGINMGVQASAGVSSRHACVVGARQDKPNRQIFRANKTCPRFAYSWRPHMDIAHPDPCPRAASFMTALHLQVKDTVSAEIWLIELIAWLSFDARDYREKKEDTVKVLVVDDYPDTAEVGCVLLHYLGHQAVAAHTGQSALRAASAYDFDLVILDIDLPDISGYEVARQLRQREKCPYIVGVSGWTSLRDQQRAISAGCHEYLTKPIDLAKIRATLSGVSRCIAPEPP